MKYSTIILTVMTVWSYNYSQDLSNYDAYDDSAKQVKVTDSLDSIKDSIAREDAKINVKEDCQLTKEDAAVMDSLENVINDLDKKFYSEKHMKEANVTKTKDKLDAINFYVNKNVISVDKAEKLSMIVWNRINVEIEGTKYLVQHQCGHEKVLALGNLKRLSIENELISNFVSSINKNIEKETFKPIVKN